MSKSKEAGAGPAAARLSPADESWFASLGWRDDAVPPIAGEADYQAYARREAALKAATAHLGFSERGASREGRLAAAIGARMADWREREEEEE